MSAFAHADECRHLLTLEHVGKQHRRVRHRPALEDITLSVAPGELVSVWGVPRSGRTTLLRVAAGVEAPDSGTVRFAGCDLTRHTWVGRQDGIGFAQIDLLAAGGQTVADYVAMPSLAQGHAPAIAEAQALEQLERVEAESCASLQVRDLTAAERARVAIAQALAVEPRLLLIDDPTRNVDLLEREAILALLRAVANDGVAVLMTTGEAAGVAGVDRALTIGDGRLRSEVVAALAPVIPLRATMAARGRSAHA